VVEIRTWSILSSTSSVKIDHPVNFVQAKPDKIDRFLLQTVKIDRAVNFDECRDGQNWPGFVSP